MKLRKVPGEWTVGDLWIDTANIVAIESHGGNKCWFWVRGDADQFSVQCSAAEFVAWLNGGGA
jgi:hypothetical protein